MSFLAGLSQSALDLLFPPLCLVCDQASEGPSPYLCVSHDGRAEILKPPLCRRCGHPFGAEWAGPRCSSCQGSSLHFLRARSAAAYRGCVRDLILAWKLGGKRGAVYPLSDWMIEAIRREGWEQDFDLVSFVPLHRKKEKRRGFNQAEELAVEIAMAFRRPVRKSLLRVRDTPAQGEPTTLSRRENVAGAFSVAPRARLAGKRLLLVDDVYTSGATVAECSKALRAAGARRVLVLTAARGGLVPDGEAAKIQDSP